MSDISLRGWKVLSGEIMIQNSLNKIKKKNYQAQSGNTCKYLKLCLQQYRYIDQNLPENRNKTSVFKDEVALCEESGSGVLREVNNRRLKGGEMKSSNSL